jgi:hypothetical protein
MLGCHAEATQSEQTTSDQKSTSICEHLLPGGKLEVRRKNGCPVVGIEDPTQAMSPAMRREFEQLEERQVEHNERIALIFAKAEEDGYLDDPDVVRLMMSTVASKYLRDKGVQREVSLDEREAYFQANQDEFGFPEMRTGRILTLDLGARDPAGVFDELEQIRTEVLAEEDRNSIFSAKVLELSTHETREKTVGLLEPTAQRGEKVTADPIIAQKLFELSEAGEVSSPFRLGDQAAIVLLVNRIEGRVPAFEEVSAIVAGKVREQRLREFVERIDEK